jgi:hypothetical protein
MKFLKDNWLIILIVIVISFSFLYMGRCSARKDIEGIMKMNTEGTAALQKVVDGLEKALPTILKAVDRYDKNQAKTLEEITKIKSAVTEIKKGIGEIPTKKVFTDLAACNKEYVSLHATATVQGELIIKYEQMIAGYESFVADANAKDIQWNAMKANLETQIGVFKTKIELDKVLIEELSKKNRQSWFTITAGGYLDPIKGKGGFAVCAGLNLTLLIKLAKRIF